MPLLTRPLPGPWPLQLLPLVPPENTYWSPYSGLDGLCGNTLLLPVEELVQMGLLEGGELPAPQPVELHADFAAVAEWKLPLLDRAAQRLLHGEAFGGLRDEMRAFRADNAWVEASALFRCGAAACWEAHAEKAWQPL